MYFGEFTLERQETSVLKTEVKFVGRLFPMGNGAELARSTKTEAKF
jgi:hypothetical protein